MSELIVKRQQAARKIKAVSNGHTVFFLRPRPGDLAKRSGDDLHPLSLLSDFAIDWDGFTEANLFPSGGPEEVEFEKDIWINWLYEHDETWEDFASALTDAMDRHKTALEDSAKN